MKRLVVDHHVRARSVLSILLLSLVLIGLWFLSNVVGKASIRQGSPGLQRPETPSAYGVNVDMTALIPGTPYTVTTASGGNFFDLAAQLGINTLRITDFQWESNGKEYPRATWRHVFAEAELHHMHIILLLIDGERYSAIQQAHTLLNRYGLARSSALWLVDLYNEPNLSNSQLMAELSEEAAYVHQVAPRVPVTIGGWKSQLPGNRENFRWQDPADISKFIELVNVVSPHLYDFEEGVQSGFTPKQWTQNFLSAVHEAAKGKPILLEEFGASNGLATTTRVTPIGSPKWQAYVYHSVLQEVTAERDQGVIGAVAWIITPRPPFPSKPDHYQGDMTGWAFVLNNGQRILPAAKEFSAAVHAR